MTRSRTAPLVAILLASVAATHAGDKPADHVDPFIGTGGHGHTYPGATLPFGMVQLSPDTRLEGWDGCSAYHFTDDVVYGFSHTHLSGTGISDYGDILLMPVTGRPLLANGQGKDPDTGYASRFDKSTERAGAGWYAVHLADYGIDVELTATERTGFHRYRYPRGKPAHVIVDLVHRDRVVESSLRIVDDRRIEGFRRSTGWARDQVVYFSASFSRPFDGAVLALDGELRPETGELNGENVKGVLSFGDRGGTLEVRVGISAVDLDGARRNLEAELEGRPFEAVRREARRRWNESLGRIEVAGGTSEQRTVFYTALYHAMIAPNLYSDVDGRYRGMDGRIHRAEGRRHYTVFSLWDTFRAAHPLYTLIETERTREFIETFLAMYEQGGRLPVWELAANETDTMIGYHSIPVIADAWAKGIRGFDGHAALEAMLHSATLDHFGLEAYRRQGFIGSEDDGESVSKTLEYAYDDWCIGSMARELGRTETAREYMRRSQAWRHLYDPQTGFMRARRNQRFIAPFDPRRVDNHYTEANSWQYSFFVPHDLESLVEVMGGDEAFVGRLDELFEADERTTGRTQPDITGRIGQYAHGNEPSHHMAWLYHYAGRPDRSAERVRQVLDTQYSTAPDGLSGNEDCGQMSAWYVLSAVGLYPVHPCSGEYVLGVPIFDRVTLNLENGRRFTIEAPGAGESRPYVRDAKLNGEPLSRSFLRHDEILSGGKLVWTPAARANLQWGAAGADRPGSRVDGAAVPAAPFVRSDSDVFRETLDLELQSSEPGAEIRYKLGTGDWQSYDRPLVLSDSAVVTLQAEKDGRSSPEVEAYFHRIPNDWSVDVRSVPNSQYTAGGPLALVDGLRGDRNWRTGGWQGYQHTDFEAVVDLGATRPVRRAGASFLQDVRSWIWMPADVVLSVSTDGESFREVARLKTTVADDVEGVFREDIAADLDGVEARYVRVFASNYGTIPDWHPGRGEGAFIFVDEILVE